MPLAKSIVPGTDYGDFADYSPLPESTMDQGSSGNMAAPSYEYSHYRRPVRRHSAMGNRAKSATSHEQSDSLKSSDNLSERNFEDKTHESNDIYGTIQEGERLYDPSTGSYQEFGSSSEPSNVQSDLPENHHMNAADAADSSQSADYNVDSMNDLSEVVEKASSTPNKQSAGQEAKPDFDPEYYQELVDNLESYVELLEEKVDLLKSEKSEMNDRLSSRSSKMRELSSSLQQTETENKRLAQELQEGKKAIAMHEKEIKKLQNIIAKLESKISNLSKDYELLKQKKNIAEKGKQKKSLFRRPFSKKEKIEADEEVSESISTEHIESSAETSPIPSKDMIAVSKEVLIDMEVMARKVEVKEDIIRELWNYIDELKSELKKSR